MAGLGNAAAKFGALTASVSRSAAAVIDLAQAAETALPALTNIQKAMEQTSFFAKALRDAMEGSGWRVNEGQTQTPEQKAYGQDVINKLKSLEERLIQVFGTNNQAAAIIQRSIESIAGGGDPGDALRVLQAILGAYRAGFQQEMFSQNPEIRALAEELDRFLSSGMLNG
jgi:hypothetical protein